MNPPTDLIFPTKALEILILYTDPDIQNLQFSCIYKERD